MTEAKSYEARCRATRRLSQDPLVAPSASLFRLHFLAWLVIPTFYRIHTPLIFLAEPRYVGDVLLFSLPTLQHPDSRSQHGASRTVPCASCRQHVRYRGFRHVQGYAKSNGTTSCLTRCKSALMRGHCHSIATHLTATAGCHRSSICGPPSIQHHRARRDDPPR